MALWSADANTSNKTTTYNNGIIKIVKSGGSLSWRNNNPGNLSYGTEASAIKNGAVGIYSYGKWNYGIFPTEEAGQKALEKWLDNHKEKTVRDAMNTYAPPEDNDTDAYRNHLSKSLNIDSKIKDLSGDEKQVLTDAIRRHEGFVPGNESKSLSDNLNIKNDEQLKELMNNPAYSDQNNPRYEDTQKAVKDYFEKQYPGKSRTDATGRNIRGRKIYIWHTEITENTCEKCEALDGTIFNTLDEIDAFPPIHPNCRCEIVEEYIDD
ncbi:MAG: hypothetical protein LBB23_00925 [Rickettsiales bacterium]|jgi:SPP1 gp7 family putative phage head morphogenesis protein|nr:hypothetical protein [Rickettsiales bacterium]